MLIFRTCIELKLEQETEKLINEQWHPLLLWTALCKKTQLSWLWLSRRFANYVRDHPTYEPHHWSVSYQCPVRNVLPLTSVSIDLLYWYVSLSSLKLLSLQWLHSICPIFYCCDLFSLHRMSRKYRGIARKDSCLITITWMLQLPEFLVHL